MGIGGQITDPQAHEAKIEYVLDELEPRRVNRHDPPMRDADLCRAMGDRVLAAMPDYAQSLTKDRFAELLCGGQNSDDALTVNEACRYLNCKIGYGRYLIYEMQNRIFRAPKK